MPIFNYRAIKGRRRIKGDLEAQDLLAAEASLRQRGLEEIRLRPQTGSLFGHRPSKGRVSDRDLVVFFRQFAAMVDSGLPVLQSLQVLGEQTSNKALRLRLYEVRGDIEAGCSLHEALAKHPGVFDDLTVNMIHAGEIGGVLDLILNRLASYAEGSARLKSKVRGALVYPALVSCVAVAVIALILVFVIPTFEQLFAGFHGGLPAPTRLAIGLSRWIQAYWPWLALGGLGSFVALRCLYRLEQVRLVMDRLVFELPLFGPLVRKAAMARFGRTLGTMISSGVPILQALDIVARTFKNSSLRSGIIEARDAIASGQTLTDPLEATGLFPPMVVHMLSVGERSGTLDSMLGKVADFYDDQVNVAVDTLTSLIEPMLIVLLGLGVGALVISMYLPIFRLAGTVAG